MGRGFGCGLGLSAVVARDTDQFPLLGQHVANLVGRNPFLLLDILAALLGQFGPQVVEQDDAKLVNGAIDDEQDEKRDDQQCPDHGMRPVEG